MAGKLLSLLEGISVIFSKCPLNSLNNQTDFDSAIRMSDPSQLSELAERGGALGSAYGGTPISTYPNAQ